LSAKVEGPIKLATAREDAKEAASHAEAFWNRIENAIDTSDDLPVASNFPSFPDLVPELKSDSTIMDYRKRYDFARDLVDSSFPNLLVSCRFVVDRRFVANSVLCRQLRNSRCHQLRAPHHQNSQSLSPHVLKLQNC
jgi:hypothetical protein